MTTSHSAYRCLLLLLLVNLPARADPLSAQAAGEKRAQDVVSAGATASPQQGETLKESIEKAQRSADQGAFQEAIQRINALIEKYPRLGFSLFICQLHMKALNPALAQECIEGFQDAVRSKQIVAPLGMLRIADLFAETARDLAHAIDSYDRADFVTALSEFARLRNDLPRLAYLCGRAHLALQHYQDAAEDFRSFLAREQAGEPRLRESAASLYREAMVKSQPPEKGLAGPQVVHSRSPSRISARGGIGLGVAAALLLGLGGLAAGLACAQPGACGHPVPTSFAVQAPTGAAAITFHF